MSVQNEGASAVPWWDMRAYDYELPLELIAQAPAAERDASRLLVYSRSSGRIAHHVFRELPAIVRPGDVFVINDCRVIPARLYGKRIDTGTRVELLLCERVEAGRWAALVRPGRSCRAGVRLRVGEVEVRVCAVREDGMREVEFACEEEDVGKVLERYGEVPLPPYIHREGGITTSEDRERYQTVYAARGMAVAAPTAGLHFTEQLMNALCALGCAFVRVTLNVGVGTFQPVKGDDARSHRMHAEHAIVTQDAAAALNEARRQGRRIIGVGTTVVRTLESCLSEGGVYRAFDGETTLFIHPPHVVRSVDALITNFHLPRSTLLMLVASFVGHAWREIYAEAIRCRYRFYSYGDAMLLQD